MVNHPAVQLNAIFEALAEPTRRAVLERLSLAGATVTELAEPFPMSLQAFLKHVRALEEAGLVRRHRIGRTNHVTIVPEALQAAATWLVGRVPAPAAEPQPVPVERQRHLVSLAHELRENLEGRMAVIRQAVQGQALAEGDFRPEDAGVRALVASAQRRPQLVEALRLYDRLVDTLASADARLDMAALSELVIPLGRLMLELRPLLPVEPTTRALTAAL